MIELAIGTFMVCIGFAVCVGFGLGYYLSNRTETHIEITETDLREMVAALDKAHAKDAEEAADEKGEENTTESL